MSEYCERYEIVGRTFGIEDYRKPGKHFMPDELHKRFRCWMGGGGIGEADTLIQARKLVYSYASGIVENNIKDIEAKLMVNIAARTLIGDNYVNLGLFKLKESVKE